MGYTESSSTYSGTGCWIDCYTPYGICGVIHVYSACYGSIAASDV